MSTRLLGMCNPLLDMTLFVDSKEFLDRFDLKESNAILVKDSHPIFEELMKHKTVNTAGGCGENSMRAAQWMLSGNGDVHFIGAIGDDEYGRILSTVAQEEHVQTHFMVSEEYQTGCCASIIYNNDRSLVAFVAAAEHYSIDHFNSPSVQDVVTGSQILYTTGFFMLSSYPTVMALCRHALETNKLLVLNISATFIVEAFWDLFNALVPYADIICGNQDEFLAMAKKMGLQTENMEEIARAVSALPKENNNRERVTLITQGSKSTIVYDGELHVYPVSKIDKSLIVDFNGAGDSFVGGFLAGLTLGKSFEKCVLGGHYCAAYIIQRTGCFFDKKDKCEFSWD